MAKLLLVREIWRTPKKSTLIAINLKKSHPKLNQRLQSKKSSLDLLLFWSSFVDWGFQTIIYDINSIRYNLQLSADLGMDQTCNWRDLVPASHQVFHHMLLMLCLESGLDMIPVQSFQMEYAPTIIHVRNCEDSHHTQLPIENNKTGNECIT